jgi:hypothetical protein
MHPLKTVLITAGVAILVGPYLASVGLSLVTRMLMALMGYSP